MDWATLYRNRAGDATSLPVATRSPLPRLPRDVAELARLAQDSHNDPAALARIVESDFELTSLLLKLAHDCSHERPARVCSVRQAIDVLGPRRSRMLVLSALLQASFGSAGPDVVHSDSFLAACLERAHFARFTAAVLGVDAECAYLGGLLQDLLLPCLLARHRQDYEQYAPEQGPLVEFERRTFGWDHASAAAQLLQSWSFPADVVCCVLYHHDASQVFALPELRRSPLAATAAAGLLPDFLRQEPHGVSRLIDLQGAVAGFNFLELAVLVDDQFVSAEPPAGHRIALCDRLGRLAVAHVEQQRVEADWTERSVGSYTLEEEIGEGAMGVVYRARHSRLRRPAAIKLMKTSHLDAQALERFEIEAQLTSGLTNPHTIRVYDYGTTPEGVLYYAMEFLKGLSLRDLVEIYGPQPAGRAIHILRQVCASLAEAHSTGLIHRDVKAENIYLTVHGGAYDFVKVLDFGLAKMVERNDDPNTPPKTVCGTPVYLAPEAILTPGEVDARTDIYALGVVAYYLVTGRMPFENGELKDILRAQVHDTPLTPSDRLGRPIANDLEAVILQCIEKDPELRPESVTRLSASLRRCAAVDTWTPEAALGWWLLHVNSKSAERHSVHAATLIRSSLRPTRRMTLPASLAELQSGR